MTQEERIQKLEKQVKKLQEEVLELHALIRQARHLHPARGIPLSNEPWVPIVEA